MVISNMSSLLVMSFWWEYLLVQTIGTKNAVSILGHFEMENGVGVFVLTGRYQQYTFTLVRRWYNEL